MKTLLYKIATESGLEIIEIEANIAFATFPDKHDFFILYSCSYDELLESAKNIVSDLEYVINDKVVDIKQREALRIFKERFLDHNLSLILMVRLEEANSEVLKNLHRIEENNIVAKKYVLPYKEVDVETLQSKFTALPEEKVKTDLNNIAIQYSKLLLKQNSETWYQLLMTLFVKIPFLNYSSSKQDHVLDNLTQNIEEKLEQKQKIILSQIEVYDFTVNIEDFISQSDLFE